MEGVITENEVRKAPYLIWDPFVSPIKNVQVNVGRYASD